jgi:iron complex outermembrane receptor protein
LPNRRTRGSSVSGYYHYDYNQNLNLSGLAADLATTQAPEWYNQFSQEFRVASPANQPIEYLAGAYFQTDNLHYRQDVNFPFFTPVIASIPPFAPLVPYLPVAESFNYVQSERVYSVFGSVSWNATEQLKLSGGLRGSWVDKNYRRPFFYGTATQVYGGVVPLPRSHHCRRRSLARRSIR